MIATAKHKSGSSGSCLGYMLGDKLKKDQQVRVIAYEGFALSRLKIAEIESVPSTKEEKKAHKKAVWQIANNLSKVFDARTALADYRVNDPLEDYVVSFVNDERERLRRKPTQEERKQYGLPKLEEGKTDERPLERIVLEEFLAEIGVHGEIEKRRRRKGKDGKKYTVKQNVHREAMFLAVAHDGTAHPHLHVLTARPDADGLVNDTGHEYRRILATVQKLSKKYNLAMKLENYEVDLEKTNEGYAAKIQARDNGLWALETATSHEELARILNEGMTGVIPTWKVHSETGKEYGILFTKIDRNGNEHTWSGSQLDRRLSYGQVEAALARNLAARQAQEAVNAEDEAAQQAPQARNPHQEAARTEDAVLTRKAQQEAAQQAPQTENPHQDAVLTRKAQQKALQTENPKQEAAHAEGAVLIKNSTQEALTRRVAERLSTLPETFVIHGDSDATLYTNRPDSMKADMLHEAARSILKYYTWGANVRCNQPKEFVDNAVDGKVFGTVKFDLGKARFIGEDRPSGMLENPDEVIQFVDHNGMALEIITPEFWDYWRLQLTNLKNWLARLSKTTPSIESVEKASAPVPPQEPQRQQEATSPASEPKPMAMPTPASTPVHRPAAAPAAQDTKPVAQVAQQQTVPTPTSVAKPAPVPQKKQEEASKPPAKTYEIIQEFKYTYKYRIKKEQDGTMKLQRLEWDKRSPIVNGKHTKTAWCNKEYFTVYREIGRDADGVYFKIKDTAGKIRYINQNGVDISQKKKQQLGLVNKGYGGPSR